MVLTERKTPAVGEGEQEGQVLGGRLATLMFARPSASMARSFHEPGAGDGTNDPLPRAREWVICRSLRRAGS